MCCCCCNRGLNDDLLLGYTSEVWKILRRVHDAIEEVPAYDLCGPEFYGLEFYLRKWGQKKGFLI